MALCILALFAGAAMADPAPFPQAPSPALSVPLLAGKSTPIGTVNVGVDGADLVVEYALDPGWSLTATHLDVESDWALFPQDKNHNPIPGKFAQKGQHPPGTQTVTYRRPLRELRGFQLALAAQADVVASTGRTDGAWADGTRFTSKGSWATWFTYTPAGQVLLDQGDAWLLLDLRGTVTDASPKLLAASSASDEPGSTFDAQLFILHGEPGITAAPLPPTVQNDLLQTQSPGDVVYFVNKDIADGINTSEAAGELTPEIDAIKEPLDSVGTLSSSCATKIKTIRKDLSLSGRGFSKSFDLDGGFKGSFAVTGNLEGAVSGELNLYEKRKKVLAWCVPYGVEFKDIHLFGDARGNVGATVSGTVEYHHAFSPVEFAKPPLTSVVFFVGPVPVYVGFNLPISAGLDLDTEATGSITFNGSHVVTGTFDWDCTLDDCTGSGDYDTDAADTTQSITGGISGHLKPEPFVNVGVRAYLYTEWIAYAQVGLRPYLLGDLWGYSGNNCGDADGDGTFETVRALTFDLDRRIDLTGQASAFGLGPKQRTLKTGKSSHISFFDLIGSDVMQPELLGPATAQVGSAADYLVKIRPCWPYDKDVTYHLDWGDGSAVQEVESPTVAYARVNHTWSAAGARTVTATSWRDKHGRLLDQSYSRSIQVVPPCTAPSITQQPQSASIDSGQSATLSVTSNGTAFQWYQGSSGDVSNPVAGGTGSALVVTPTATTSYWVRVASACGAATDSSTATVTVSVAALCAVDGTPCGGDGNHTCQGGQCVCSNCASGVCCGASGNTVCDGQAHFDPNTGYAGVCASTLSGCGAANDFDGTNAVFHAGDVLACVKYDGSYQWYPRRPSPRCQEVSSVCGFACSTHYNDGGGFICDQDGNWNQSPPLSYCYSGTIPDGWSCRIPPACTAPQIASQPQPVTVTEGQSATLSVGATGTPTLSYQWYEGPVTDTSRPLAGGTGATVVVTPSATTSYWVRVANGCGSASSGPVTVTVSPCDPAAITTQPQPVTLDPGQTAILAVTASGTAPSFQWYQGSRGDTSSPLLGAFGNTLVVAPQSTTSYWVRAFNACGQDDSVTATVTVNVSCGPDGTPCGGDGNHTCQGGQCVCSNCASGVCCGASGNSFCDGQPHFDPNTGYTGACAATLPGCGAANDFDGGNAVYHDGDILACVKFDGAYQWFPRRPSPRCQEVAPVCGFLCSSHFPSASGGGFMCDQDGVWNQNPPLPYCYDGTIPDGWSCP